MRGDIHTHSKYSPDSNLEPAEIIKTARMAGLGFIAISDHNRFVQHKGDMIILNAEEVSSADGHILALFIEGEVPPKLSQEETVEKIRDLNGIAICAHPYRLVNGVRSRFENIYDAIEAKNGRCGTSCNARAQRLATELGIPVTAGSDSHYYNEVGKVYMEVEEGDEESIRKSIVSGRVKIGGVDLSLAGKFNLYFKMGKEYIQRGFKRI